MVCFFFFWSFFLKYHSIFHQQQLLDSKWLFQVTVISRINHWL
jgi:hypothetical protein